MHEMIHSRSFNVLFSYFTPPSCKIWTQHWKLLNLMMVFYFLFSCNPSNGHIICEANYSAMINAWKWMENKTNCGCTFCWCINVLEGGTLTFSNVADTSHSVWRVPMIYSIGPKLGLQRPPLAGISQGATQVPLRISAVESLDANSKTKYFFQSSSSFTFSIQYKKL